MSDSCCLLYHCITSTRVLLKEYVAQTDRQLCLQVYFDILDGQKKGYLDKDALDIFTKEIAEKCSTKEKKVEYTNITQLVFNSIQPKDSTK